MDKKEEANKALKEMVADQPKTLKLKDIISKIELNPKRMPDEDWKNYKLRRKNNKILLDAYLDGTIIDA